jgi:hypothetical protein
MLKITDFNTHVDIFEEEKNLDLALSKKRYFFCIRHSFLSYDFRIGCAGFA